MNRKRHTVKITAEAWEMLLYLTAASGRTNPAEVERMIAMAHARLAKRSKRISDPADGEPGETIVEEIKEI